MLCLQWTSNSMTNARPHSGLCPRERELVRSRSNNLTCRTRSNADGVPPSLGAAGEASAKKWICVGRGEGGQTSFIIQLVHPIQHSQPPTPMKAKSLILTLAAALLAAFSVRAAEPIKIGYSDWPGWVAWEIAKDKGLFKQNGVDVK